MNEFNGPAGGLRGAQREAVAGLPDAGTALAELIERMKGAVAFDAKFVGIYSGGAWLAERLAEAIPGDHPVGYIDASFYRDDYARKGLKPEVHATRLPFEIEGATIVLVDDVLYTGRSVRAAINELFDYVAASCRSRLPTSARAWSSRASSRSCSLAPPTARWRSPPKPRPSPAMRNPQLNANGELTHLLTLEGLPAEVIRRILDTAVPFTSIGERDVKKVPLLRGRSVFNLFFENSTRTRTTFEIAAKRLSADVINLNIGASSTTKGETLLDTSSPRTSTVPAAPTCTSSTRATAATRTRRRGCSTSSRSATTRRTSPASPWRSSATSCTRASPAR